MAYNLRPYGGFNLQTLQNMKHLFFCVLFAASLTIAGCTGCRQSAEKTGNTEESGTIEGTNASNDMIQETEFRISTTKGDMIVKLYNETPLHKDNFTKLVSKRFYDGILFHRVIDGFMIQCGDPLTKEPGRKSEWGTGGPGYTIPAEIREEFTHKKGALAAARRGDMVNPEKESSGSQFYIVQSETGCAHLDGEYTIFGEVVEGFDVIDKIASAPTGYADCPIEDIAVISITKLSR